MKQADKESLKRLERLIHIKQTYVSVAETNLKHAEGEVRRLEMAEREIAGSIQKVRSGIAYLKTASAADVQNGEKYIQALELRRNTIHQSLEEATTDLEQRRAEWTEAMREQKIIEKAQERQLHQCQREDEVAQGKSQDEMTVSRYSRNRPA